MSARPKAYHRVRVLALVLRVGFTRGLGASEMALARASARILSAQAGQMLSSEGPPQSWQIPRNVGDLLLTVGVLRALMTTSARMARPDKNKVCSQSRLHPDNGSQIYSNCWSLISLVSRL